MYGKFVAGMIMAAALSLAAAAHAAPATKTYQVTGPVLELTDAKIVVDKDGEKWEIARTADVKVAGDLKVGAKVTIKYYMTATAVENKDGAAAAKDEAAAEPKADKGAKKGVKADAKKGKAE